MSSPPVHPAHGAAHLPTSAREPFVPSDTSSSSSSPTCSASMGTGTTVLGARTATQGWSWAVLALLPGLFMATPAEGAFALRAGLERAAANIQEPWIALPALLLHRSPPWGKVGTEELQWWTGNWQLQFFGCPVLVFPPLSCLHCVFLLQGSLDAPWCSVAFCSHPLPFSACLSPNTLTNEFMGRQEKMRDEFQTTRNEFTNEKCLQAPSEELCSCSWRTSCVACVQSQ